MTSADDVSAGYGEAMVNGKKVAVLVAMQVEGIT